MSDAPKVFVLDTSVLLYDSDALHNFQEHDVALPITVLEELDQFKKGGNVINLQARQFIRHLDRLSDHNLLAQTTPPPPRSTTTSSSRAPPTPPTRPSPSIIPAPSA